MRDEYRAADLLPLAMQWLRDTYPDALLVPELCVGNWGAARLDVGAITETEIVGVEIKGDGDSPARLDRQGLAYGMVATRMWLLAAPSLWKRCYRRKPVGWGMLEATHAGIVSWEQAHPPDHQSVGAMLGVLWASELRCLWQEAGMGERLGRPPRGALQMRQRLGDILPLRDVRAFLCRTLRERDWQAKGKRVFRPGDPLPPHPLREAAAA